ncbi:MAG: hypoxanthine phosphoribosyltransferase [Turicibacter sp.]|nr:hypoxanthine phosphoribosyltransferase [Turicibacter sp.]
MKETVSMLISQDAIRERVRELAHEIMHDYKREPITLVCALKGALIFMADLARDMDTIVGFDFIGTSSYGEGTSSTGRVQLTKEIETDPVGKHLILVEDILDTGYTISFLKRHLLAKNPLSLKICSLLDKPDRRIIQDATADYIGFTIPDQFVVGYGLDYAQRYRNLPYIGVLNIED